MSDLILIFAFCTGHVKNPPRSVVRSIAREFVAVSTAPASLHFFFASCNQSDMQLVFETYNL